jgi:hypothetical protein
VRYEQAVLPLAFAMLVIGWGLLCLVRPTLVRFANLLWPCGMVTTTYTPGMAFGALCLVFFLGLALRRWKEHRPEALAWLSWRDLSDSRRLRPRSWFADLRLVHRRGPSKLQAPISSLAAGSSS